MYHVYAAGQFSFSTLDASEAVTVYRAELDAGTRPSMCRHDEPIVHIGTCADCGAPVPQTHQDREYGRELVDLCPVCLDVLYAQVRHYADLE